MPSAMAGVQFEYTFFADAAARRRIVDLTMNYMAVEIERYIVPAMRDVAPERLGNLKKSIVARRTPNGVTIYANYYWRFQRGLDRRWFQIFKRDINTLLQRAFNRAVAEVLPPA